MSAVLDIDNLLESPIADLHALAGELEIEGYRTLRKPDLAIAILESRGAVGDEIRPAVEAKASELAAAKAERERELAEQERLEDEARDAAAAERAAREESRPGRSGQRSGQRGGQSRGRQRGGRERQPAAGRQARGRGGERQREPKADARAEKGQTEKSQRGRKAEERAPEPTTPIRGVFEPGSGGGGRLRTDISKRVRQDADVPRGDVRRWNLKRGDLIEGEAKKARRGRTDFVIAKITSVNGQDAEQRKQKSPAFDQIEVAPIGTKYAKRLFKHAPVGAGSRTVVTGPTRAAATEMLFSLAAELAKAGVVTSVIVVAPRPEEEARTDAQYEIVVAKTGKPVEEILPALELVLERDRRLAESGRETALLVDGLDLLPADKASEIFMCARNLASAGSLTVACSAGAGSVLEAQATSIGFVAGGRKLKLDKKSSWSK